METSLSQITQLANRSGGGITAMNSDVRLCGSKSFFGSSVDDVGQYGRQQCEIQRQHHFHR